ncbi:MAG: hypothetical protein GX378_04355, partial [Bacteroidales bacterium]|nr:hypothetical protein [Bacteroidales bacterium]
MKFIKSLVLIIILTTASAIIFSCNFSKNNKPDKNDKPAKSIDTLDIDTLSDKIDYP